jgi:hypothetical protein
MGAKVRKAQGIPRGRGLLGGERYVFWEKKGLYVQIRFLVKRARGRTEKRGKPLGRRGERFMELGGIQHLIGKVPGPDRRPGQTGEGGGKTPDTGNVLIGI